MLILSRLSVLLALVILSACVGTTANYTPMNLPENSLDTIASDIAPIIADNHPAKSTAFVLRSDDFSKVLAEHLGKHGYEVMFYNQGQQTEGEEIRYTIDWVSSSSMYLALTVNNSQRYTRTYTVDAGTLIPDKSKIIGVNDVRR